MAVLKTRQTVIGELFIHDRFTSDYQVRSIIKSGRENSWPEGISKKSLRIEGATVVRVSTSIYDIEKRRHYWTKLQWEMVAKQLGLRTVPAVGRLLLCRRVSTRCLRPPKERSVAQIRKPKREDWSGFTVAATIVSRSKRFQTDLLAKGGE